MSDGASLLSLSAEFYKGSLVGKEVVPNMVDYAKEFLQPEFAAAGFHTGSVFEVSSDIMFECVRHIEVRDDAGHKVVSQAYRFNVLGPL